MSSLPEPLSAGDADYVNGEIHYFGGNRGQDRVTDYGVHYALRLGDSKWHTAATFPNPRDHFTSVVYNNKIYTFGGEIGHDTYHLQQNDVRVYDPATDRWTQLASMPVAKSHTESSAFIHDGLIYV